MRAWTHDEFIEAAKLKDLCKLLSLLCGRKTESDLVLRVHARESKGAIVAKQYQVIEIFKIVLMGINTSHNASNKPQFQTH